MQSPFIFSEEDDIDIAYDLWQETDGFLNPCWKPQIESTPIHTGFKSGESEPHEEQHHSVMSKTGVRSILNHASDDSKRAILLLGIIGIALFSFFLVNLILWSRNRKKVTASVYKGL